MQRGRNIEKEREGSREGEEKEAREYLYLSRTYPMPHGVNHALILKVPEPALGAGEHDEGMSSMTISF